jgi:hypothetical protein
MHSKLKRIMREHPRPNTDWNWREADTAVPALVDKWEGTFRRDTVAAGLGEGLPPFSLPHSRLYRDSL